MTTEKTPSVPHHVEETVATIAALRAAHYREARALQKAVSRATSGVAQPATLILITVAIAGWVTLNLVLPEFGRAALDPFPFPLLAAVLSTVSLYLAAMILITQRHDDELATRREQMTLELAILSEQKSAKIITLLEEFRRKRQLLRRSGRGTGTARRSSGRARRDTGGGKGGGRRLDRQILSRHDGFRWPSRGYVGARWHAPVR
jgi:uncharacterized membrane protein